MSSLISEVLCIEKPAKTRKALVHEQLAMCILALRNSELLAGLAQDQKTNILD